MIRDTLLRFVTSYFVGADGVLATRDSVTSVPRFSTSVLLASKCVGDKEPAASRAWGPWAAAGELAQWQFGSPVSGFCDHT
jgi:hypothetical protein